MMKILVTGASGQLGRKVLEACEQAGFSTLGLCHLRPGSKLVPCDLTDPGALNQACQKFTPEVIVHCAAIRDPDACEQTPYMAKRVNINGTRHVVELARAAGARLVFISTDYVFDGQKPPYSENSKISPVNYYGRTKVEGEKFVRRAGKEHAILRVALLYNRDNVAEPSFLRKLFDAIRAGKRVALDHRRPRYPTLVDDVARAITLIAVEKLSGTYHFSGRDRLTNYEAAKRIGEILALDTYLIDPDLDAKPLARRPGDTQLDCSKLDEAGLEDRTPFEKAVWDYWRKYRTVVEGEPA